MKSFIAADGRPPCSSAALRRMRRRNASAGVQWHHKVTSWRLPAEPDIIISVRGRAKDIHSRTSRLCFRIMKDFVEYIPIITTIFSTFFSVVMWRHYMTRKKAYLLWWFIGIVTFAVGTLTESLHALLGWYDQIVRLWYISGALLGGYPLAQGSVYLLMNRRFADVSAIFWTTVIITASICVWLSPIRIPDGFEYKLTGRVFAWEWVRLFSPFINMYSLLFLVGGAVYSAMQYFRKDPRGARFRGNILIAIGGLLPGIGGTFTRMGYVNVLFVTELIGLVMIYLGYRLIRRDNADHAQSDQVYSS
jgi:hypothetical protein